MRSKDFLPFTAKDDFLPRPRGNLEFPPCPPALLPTLLEVGAAARKQKKDILYHVYYPRCLPGDTPPDFHGIDGTHSQLVFYYLVGPLEVEPRRRGRQAADGTAVVTSAFLHFIVGLCHPCGHLTATAHSAAGCPESVRTAVTVADECFGKGFEFLNGAVDADSSAVVHLEPERGIAGIHDELSGSECLECAGTEVDAPDELFLILLHFFFSPNIVIRLEKRRPTAYRC